MPVVKSISIAIADESFLFAKVLKNYIIEQDRFHALVHTVTLTNLISQLEDLSPGILLMDILQQPNITETLITVKDRCPDLKVIILSMCEDPELINTLLNAGIYGYVSKMNEPEELLDAIIAAAEEKIHRSSVITDFLYQKQQRKYGMFSKADTISLNNRERKVLQLLWEEKSTREIASEFFLSTKSIEKIRQDMKEKLGIKSTVGLLKYAISNNIISVSAAEPCVRSER
ncbi:response regulator transcription factor [Chitinophaga solisilvae]|uniref:response regulator transcription factor n=1 Tax=Chitinophaga solisilvae TaxID=1233460 RepID=UPI001368CD62|nr:response regulator transcription factor [Chitinophaga solisilvae]